MKREREPTPEEFDKLLAWLDPDREAAGAKYETIHSALLRFFAVRGCDVDWLVEETINRVTVRIEKVVHHYDSPITCFKGFARKVYHEWQRGQKPPPDPPPRPDPQILELEDRCLTRCMGELPHTDADLFSRYFQENTPARMSIRKKLAEDLKLTSNALAIKVSRIRKSLRKCMEDCLAEALLTEIHD